MVSTEKERTNLDEAASGEDQQAYDQFVALYDESLRNLTEGEIVRGKVMSVGESSVIVDVGYKSEGLIPLEEFEDVEGNITVKEGDEVEVLLEKTEDVEGHILLSYSKAERMRIWTDVEQSFKEGRIIKGRVIERIKGGLTVDVGVRAFLPGSLADIKPLKNLEALRGKELEFKVISLDRRRNNIVLSRKAVLEKEYEKKKAETLEKLEEGVTMKGVVKNITDYGAFIDLGGIDGLLHITDISWGRVNHPSEHFAIGDEVEVVVLKFDRETERVSLGYKQKGEDPWVLVDKKFPVGSRVHGKVVSLVDYGAFVELEEGVEGLIHVSEMSWTKKVVNPSEVLKKGDTVRARITNIDVENQRVSLSIKEFLPNEWQDFVENNRVGDVITGRIVNVTDFGLFIDVYDGLEGLAHISEIDFGAGKLSDFHHSGDWVRARILRIEEDDRKVGLTLRGVTQPTEEEIAELDAAARKSAEEAAAAVAAAEAEAAAMAEADEETEGEAAAEAEVEEPA